VEDSVEITDLVEPMSRTKNALYVLWNNLLLAGFQTCQTVQKTFGILGEVVHVRSKPSAKTVSANGVKCFLKKRA
jgi:hypothetical protein